MRLTVTQHLANQTHIFNTESFSSAINCADALEAMNKVPSHVWQGERCVYDSAIKNVVHAWNGVAEAVNYDKAA